jgi:hypothetical protein
MGVVTEDVLYLADAQMLGWFPRQIDNLRPPDLADFDLIPVLRSGEGWQPEPRFHSR